MSILVVDDERLIRWSLKQRLEEAGYTVAVAATGRQTMETLDKNLSLVLLDLKLPDASGLELLRAIRTRLPSCRIIMMTAHWTPEIEQEALSSGASEVLQKPFSLDRITRTVESALS